MGDKNKGKQLNGGERLPASQIQEKSFSLKVKEGPKKDLPPPSTQTEK